MLQYTTNLVFYQHYFKFLARKLIEIAAVQTGRYILACRTLGEAVCPGNTRSKRLLEITVFPPAFPIPALSHGTPAPCADILPA